MTSDPQNTTSKTPEYLKIPNVPGLYRHTASGRYYGVKKVKGKRKERSLETTDRKIAEKRLQEWISSLSKVDREVERTTYSKLVKSYLTINQSQSESSRYIISSTLDDFAQFLRAKGCGDPEARNIRTSYLEEWLAALGNKYKNTSYNRYAGVVKGLFEMAVNDRIIAESPFDRVRTRWKRPQEPVRTAPTQEQFAAIVNSVRQQVFSRHSKESADFLEFLGLAGVGQAEASSLTWGDIDFDAGRIAIRRHKTDRRFFVPIYAHLRPFLDRLRQEAGDTVTKDQKVLGIADAKKALQNACVRLGLPHFSQRNLRQYLIKQLWQAGVDKKLIAKWQGHQDGGKLIIDTYTEVFGSDDGDYEVQQLAKLTMPASADQKAHAA